MDDVFPFVALKDIPFVQILRKLNYHLMASTIRAVHFLQVLNN